MYLGREEERGDKDSGGGTMNKEEHIEKYGEEAYKTRLKQTETWIKTHNRKGGANYPKLMLYHMTGLQYARRLIRNKHGLRWKPFKQIIAPESQIHHEWIPGTADYTGVALVETDQHIHGFIDVIQILEGEITLFTEAEIRNRGGLYQ